MDLRALRDVLAVARAGSISRAAAEMGVAQPVVTRRVQSIEASLGTPIFHRNGRGVVPTETGERFLKDLAPLLQDLDRLQSGTRAAARQPQGEVVLAMPPSLSGAVGAALIQGFKAEYPGVRLHLIDGFSGYLTEWLTSGRVDMAVINDARRPPSLAVEPLLTLALSAVGSPAMLEKHLGPDPGPVPFRRLIAAPLILPGSHHGLTRAVEAAAAEAGATVNQVLELDSNLALADLLRAEFALSILPPAALGAQETGLARRAIADPALGMRFALAFSPRRPYTPVTQALAAHLRRQVRTALASARLQGELPG
jgi:LysR family transcriptional regulator, nitrogen assimilation regulatory protein